MAGEWLKMECSTPDKLEVFTITTTMGWLDPDLTVGKLFRIWRWFDQQTLNGNADGVTHALLDHITGATGFAQAMVNVGWLAATATGLRLPNFERHNGATAKTRAQTAKRVANHRANPSDDATGNAQNVTAALAREEKKRKEKKEEPRSRAEAKPDASASRLPADWSPDEAGIEFIATKRPELLVAETVARFRDYWIAQPGVNGRKTDWSATWRNWVRNEKSFQARASPAGAPSAAFDPTAYVNRNRKSP